MGKALSIMTHPLRTFNVENRAYKVISKDKPTPAPTYKSTEEQLKVAHKLNPNFMEIHYKKDPKLDIYLKKVFITSDDPEVINENNLKTKYSLPQKSISEKNFEFGFWEPIIIPPGKCTLKNILTFMSQHMNDSQKHAIGNIALEYKLDSRVVASIIEYYKLLKIIKKEDPNEDLEDNKSFTENLEDRIVGRIKSD